MMEKKLRLTQAVIVEGKYDKIKLDALIDALILPVGGFRLYSDRRMQALIRRLAATCGVVVLTDSDVAGFRIRRFIAGIAGGGRVIDAYIPDLPGREPRKSRPSREGKLGVEGVPAELLVRALADAGLPDTAPPAGPRITRRDLYEAGLSGARNSRALRAALIRELNLPEHLSSTALPAVLERLLTREELFERCARLRDQSEGGDRACP